MRDELVTTALESGRMEVVMTEYKCSLQEVQFT